MLPKFTRVGVNGDPLADGKLDLPELRELPKRSELQWAGEFIESRRWRVSRDGSHSYTIRKWEPSPQGQADFDRMVVLIRQCGEAGFFLRERYLYWRLGDMRYWTMGWPVPETTVINRALVKKPRKAP